MELRLIEKVQEGLREMPSFAGGWDLLGCSAAKMFALVFGFAGF